MWRIVKAELASRCFMYVLVGNVIGLMTLLFLLRGDRALPASVSVYRSLVVLVMVLVFFYEVTQITLLDRTRIHVLLPVPIRSIAVSRLLFFLLVWVCVVLVCSLSILIVTGLSLLRPTFLQMSALTGVFLWANALFHIQPDLDHLFARQRYRIVLKVVWSFILVFSYAALIMMLMPMDEIPVLNHVKGWIWHYLFSSISGMLLFILTGIGFSILSVFVFEKRSDYVK